MNNYLSYLALLYLLVYKVASQKPIIEQIDKDWISDFKQEEDTFSMNINEKLNKDIVLFNIKLDNGGIPGLYPLSEENVLEIIGAKLKLADDPYNYSLLIERTESYDEDGNEDKLYEFQLNGENNGIQYYLIFQLKLNNVNDNKPILEQLSPCSIKETNLTGLVVCTYTLTDKDGFLEKPDKILSKYSETFEFVYNSPVTSKDKTAEMALKNIMPLDYEKNKIFIFDLTVQDSKFSDSAKIVVEIEDVSDRPPEWTKIVPSIQLPEKETKEYEFQAIDGDYGINATVNYKCHPEKQEHNKYFSIGTATGKFIINHINRDIEKIETFKVTITAYEENDRASFIEQSIIIIVEDKNDNSPNITLSKYSLQIKENTSMTLDVDITISDIDLGDNARYNVFLRDEYVEDIFSKSFQIIPNNGYQESTFSITIVNIEKLDYDRDEKWRDFKFQIYTEEILDTSHNDTKYLNINLTNWNDELPYFTENPYKIPLKETVGRNEVESINVLINAIDWDYGDSVSYSLVGESIKRILEINEATGEIKTLLSSPNKQLFDFETQEDVIVQITATDHLDGDGHTHTTFGQVFISLIDVNDETPSIITGSDPIEVKENLKHGTEIISDIIASDDDANCILKFAIDWDLSYFTKNGLKIHKDKISEYKKWIEVVTEKYDDLSTKVRAKLVINEVKEKNTPDYEIFDAVRLHLLVEDTKQDVGVGTTFVILVISIININDNAPVFTDISLNAKRNVVENSATGTLVGTISATDEDNLNEVTYSIIEAENMENYTNLIEINEITGELLTTNQNINADAVGENGIPLYSLNYTVSATDKTHTTESKVLISIIDINDVSPIFSIDPTNQDVPEATKGHIVMNVVAIDGDRDAPHNIISYSLDDDSLGIFTIEENNVTSDVTIFTKNANLDRDNGVTKMPLTIQLKDYIDDDNRFPVTKTITINIIDINNKIPEILTSTISCTENLNKEENVGEIEAFDKDEKGKPNSQIRFEILDVKAIDAREPETDMFTISSEINGIGIIKSNISSLKSYHGIYEISIITFDFGIPQLSDTKSIMLTVLKYNFNKPEFIFPNDGAIHYLKKGQPLNKPLILYNDDNFKDIKATDKQGEKYEISLKISEDTHGNIFNVRKNGKSSGNLVLISDERNEDTKYEITIVATDDGDPQLTNNATITIGFYDLDSEPTYDVHAIILELEETDLDVDKPKETAKAKFGMENGDMEEIVYYHKYSDPTSKFEVDLKTGDLTLKEPIVVEDYLTVDVVIIASRREAGNSNPDDASKLTVTINFIDVNNHPPKFRQNNYFSGITTLHNLNDIIITALADDPDTNDKLEYSILTQTFNATGTDLPTTLKFKMNITTASITLDFTVQSNMKGYFLFDIQANDSIHQATANVKVYVISDVHMVKIQLENKPETLYDNQAQVRKLLSEVFNFVCEIRSIDPSPDENGVPMDMQTDLVVYFIDDVKNEAVDSTRIFDLMNNIEIFAELKSGLLSNGLSLLKPKQTDEVKTNIEEFLKTWLIGVSVVLGSLCVILIIAFIVKVRMLSQRINKLSTIKFDSVESNLNRTAVPNTNRRAAEGANPAFQNAPETTMPPQYDRESVSSGDSDLGIDNNTDFDI